MSRLKDSLLDSDEWDRTPDKFVCADMFDDPALAAVVQDNLSARHCSYCGKTAKQPIAAPLDVVMERIWEGIGQHYENAGNGVGWEGGWVGATTWDTYDLIEETVALAENAPRALFDDIVAALPMQDWSRIDPYGARYGDVMNWSWEDFTSTIKHVRRYFFEQHLGPSDRRSEKVSPIDLLGSMAERARSYGLFRDLSAGQTFYRSRGRETRARITDPLELGPPPPERASQSRMSPAGIPMFYGAEDPETAIAETITQPGRYALARFRTTRPIKVLDLRRAPWVSIFDSARGDLSEWCRFMGSFIRDFQRPVEHNGSQHYAYAPTQVVTEFLRTEAGRHGGLDGVLYRSVRRPAGSCVVLFAERSDVQPSIESAAGPNPAYLLRLERVWNRKLVSVQA